MGAPIASPSFCIQAGGKGSRTSSKWALAITASRSGLGMPFLLVLPSAASVNIVSISCSNWSAGRISQRKTASRVAGVPERVLGAGGDDDLLAGGGDDLAASGLEAELALEHLEALALVGVEVGGGDEAARLDDDLDQDVLAVGVGRGLDEPHQLAGDRIVENVSLADHLLLLRIRIAIRMAILGRRARGASRRGNDFGSVGSVNIASSRGTMLPRAAVAGIVLADESISSRRTTTRAVAVGYRAFVNRVVELWETDRGRLAHHAIALVVGIGLVVEVAIAAGDDRASLLPLAVVAAVGLSLQPIVTFTAPLVVLATLVAMVTISTEATEDSAFVFIALLLLTWCLGADNDRRHALAGLIAVETATVWAN